MGVQSVGPEAPVERLDVGIVGRLAGPGEVQRHTAGVGPQIKVLADELEALIDPDGLWLALYGAGRGSSGPLPAGRGRAEGRARRA